MSIDRIVAYLVRHYSALARRSALMAMVVDALSWSAALGLGLAIRYELAYPPDGLGDFLLFVPLVVATQFAFGSFFGLYRARWRVGSFDEVAALARTAAATTAVTFLVNSLLSDRPVPLSVSLGGGALALVGMAGTRYVWRLLIERHRRPDSDRCQRMLVFGAGDGGMQVVSAMLRDPHSPYLPVALLDDDPRKRHREVTRVRVMGTRRAMAEVAERMRAEILLIAIPSAEAELLRELTDQAQDLGLEVKVLPSAHELFDGRVGVDDIRTPTIADLLGRHEIDTDLHAISGYLTGKRVLVTGAGGSIGSELCRQIDVFAPGVLVMLDRDESALHGVQLSLEGQALLDTPNLVVADIRDAGRMVQVFERWQPEVVFHAAALKHLPLLEQHPCEAVKTNIWGTEHVLHAARATGVECFVNISTDKAADPTSVLGYTKRVAERLTADAARQGGLRYLSVRFGNVLGSRGSMLGTFKAQIDAGGPVTVTHPDVTRFFMTVKEAVQLVVQAGAIGNGGEVLVLDMGEPVAIADVARQLMVQADHEVEVVYTGLRPGEKLHEALWGEGEVGARPAHPLISHVEVPALAAHLTTTDVPLGSPELLVSWLQGLSTSGLPPRHGAFAPAGASWERAKAG